MENLRMSLQNHPRSVYLLYIGVVPESIKFLKASEFKCREIELGRDYIRWQKKKGLILHGGIEDGEAGKPKVASLPF
jgi:hypothetical protein